MMRKIPREILDMKNNIHSDEKRLTAYAWATNISAVLSILFIILAILLVVYGVFLHLLLLVASVVFFLLWFLCRKSYRYFNREELFLINKLVRDEYRYKNNWKNMKHSYEYLYYADFEERIRERLL